LVLPDPALPGHPDRPVPASQSVTRETKGEHAQSRLRGCRLRPRLGLVIQAVIIIVIHLSALIQR